MQPAPKHLNITLILLLPILIYIYKEEIMWNESNYVRWLKTLLHEHKRSQRHDGGQHILNTSVRKRSHCPSPRVVVGVVKSHGTGVIQQQESVGTLSVSPHRKGVLPRATELAERSRVEYLRTKEYVLWDIYIWEEKSKDFWERTKCTCVRSCLPR